MGSIIGALLFSFVTLQEETLIDRAQRNNGRAITTIDVNLPAATLTDLARDSTVIVRGVVRAVRTRLSRDQTRVVTEYEINAREFYKGLLKTFAKPGETERITALRTGGRLEVNGLTLGTDFNEWPGGDDLRVNEQVIVFLMPDPYELGQYRIVRSQYGAFRVKGDDVIALTDAIAARRGDKPMDTTTFARELRSLLARK